MVGMKFFFFQAEDGIRDRNVTGVQTCALPIFPLNLNFAKAFFAETEQRPTVLIHNSICTSNQPRSFGREQLSLEIGGLFRIGKAGEKPWSHARTEVREQVGSSDAGKLLAQTGRLLVQLIQRCAFAPLLERSARAARSFLRSSKRINIAAKGSLHLGKEFHRALKRLKGKRGKGKGIRTACGSGRAQARF